MVVLVYDSRLKTLDKVLIYDRTTSIEQVAGKLNLVQYVGSPVQIDIKFQYIKSVLANDFNTR